MKKYLSTFMLCCLLLTLCACDEVSHSGKRQDVQAGNVANSKQSGAAGYQKISAQKAHEIITSTEHYILLDVRTEKEFSAKRISGAILIPDYEIFSRASAELPDKDALILVYCRSGARSEKAAKMLIGMGYNKVYDFGGINDWIYETVSD